MTLLDALFLPTVSVAAVIAVIVGIVIILSLYFLFSAIVEKRKGKGL